MGKPRTPTIQRKSRGWEPTLTQIAHRANELWHQDGCPARSELGYWLRARQELKHEYREMVSLEDSTTRAVLGMSMPAPIGAKTSKRAGAQRP